VKYETGLYLLVDSRHVSFDESVFPGFEDIEHIMSDEDSSDERHFVRFCSEEYFAVISDDEVSVDGIDESESSSKSDNEIHHSDDKVWRIRKIRMMT